MEETRCILKGTLYYESNDDIKDITETNPINELFDKYDFDWVTKDQDGSIWFIYPNICLIYSEDNYIEEWNEISNNWYWSNVF